LNKTGFIEMGFPYYGWLTAITVAPIKIASVHNIGLIFYGEDGEVEYGGSTETSNNPIYSTEYQKKVYLEGGYENVINTQKVILVVMECMTGGELFAKISERTQPFTEQGKKYFLNINYKE
jgi:hypothetical protein